MSMIPMGSTGENVTPEVTAQTPLVTEILESLVGKVTLANATPETILEGYSAYVGQQLINGTLPATYGAYCEYVPSSNMEINNTGISIPNPIGKVVNGVIMISMSKAVVSSSDARILTGFKFKGTWKYLGMIGNDALSITYTPTVESSADNIILKYFRNSEYIGTLTAGETYLVIAW